MVLVNEENQLCMIGILKKFSGKHSSYKIHTFPFGFSFGFSFAGSFAGFLPFLTLVSFSGDSVESVS